MHVYACKNAWISGDEVHYGRALLVGLRRQCVGQSENIENMCILFTGGRPAFVSETDHAIGTAANTCVCLFALCVRCLCLCFRGVCTCVIVGERCDRLCAQRDAC